MTIGKFLLWTIAIAFTIGGYAEGGLWGAVVTILVVDYLIYKTKQEREKPSG